MNSNVILKDSNHFFFQSLLKSRMKGIISINEAKRGSLREHCRMDNEKYLKNLNIYDHKYWYLISSL